MWLFIKLAYRNILRNKRRTILAGIAIGIGLAGLIFSDALMAGMLPKMIKSATETYMGEAQIHKKGFFDTMESKIVIENIDKVYNGLKKEKIVKYVTKRTQSIASISSSSNLKNIMLTGIDPKNEKNISKIDEAIEKGKFIDSDNKIMIGRRLADMLEVDIGDKIVVTVAEAYSGESRQELFRVGGIFNFNIREIDREIAFINIKKAQKMLNIGNDAHEIAVVFKDMKYSQNKNLDIWDRYSKDGNEFKSWEKLIPELSSIVGMSDFGLLIMALILFGVVAIGIVNTLFMSLYERMFEFGVLKAIGTRGGNLPFMIVFEAIWLSIFSVIIGVVIGGLVTYITTKTGIDYTGTEFAGVTMTELLYPVLKVKQFILYPMLLIIFTALVGLYPAIYAMRLTPSKAMKKSL